MLQHRLRESTITTNDIEVAVSSLGALPWIDRSSVQEEVRRWVEAKRQDLVNAAQLTEENKRHPAEPIILDAEIASPDVKNALHLPASGIWSSRAETRTIDDYRAQLDAWAESLLRVAPQYLVFRLATDQTTAIAISVTNRSEKFLADAEVKLHVDLEHATVYDLQPDDVELPALPRRFGDHTLTDVLGDLGRSMVPPLPPLPNLDGYLNPTRPAPPDTWVESSANPAIVTFRPGDLRPLATQTSEEFHLLLPTMPSADSAIHARWTVTLGNRDGLITGIVPIPLREAPIDATALLEQDQRSSSSSES